MKRILFTLLGVSFLFFANAQVPGTLSYQGILVNSLGDPVADGNHSVTFNFYLASTGGVPVFARGPFTVVTYKGMFTFILGTGSPSGNDPLPVLASDPNYIGAAQYFVGLVADAVVLDPRVQLSSVPYAFTAQNANAVSATNVNAGTLADARLETTVDINSLNVGTAGQLVVNSTGNIAKVNNVATSFPSVQGAAGSLLSNDGSGNLSWISGGSGSGSGWGLTGNSGTIGGTHFLGTTDNVPLSFRVNNTKAGSIDHLLSNTFFGYQSGSANTNGSGNTASGFGALSSNTTGASNVANGFLALGTSTTGVNNVGVGSGALQYNTVGGSNVASGYQALPGAKFQYNGCW